VKARAREPGPAFPKRSGGPFALPAGAWTDKTAMALCLAESLVARGNEIEAMADALFEAGQRR